jgi:hypothetical protein
MIIFKLDFRKWRELADDCIIRSIVNSYISQNIVRVIKTRRMRWAGVQHAWEGNKGNAYKILVRKPKGKRPRG